MERADKGLKRFGPPCVVKAAVVDLDLAAKGIVCALAAIEYVSDRGIALFSQARTFVERVTFGCLHHNK